MLRDLADGWLALGFGGTRGRGSVRVSRVAFTGDGLTGVWAGLAGRTLAEVIADPPDGVEPRLRGLAEGDEPVNAPGSAPLGAPSRPGDRRRRAGLVRRVGPRR